MSNIILKAENISKQYRLGTVGTGTLSHDLNRWWHVVRGKEDPYLKIGSINDRSEKASEDYVWALKDIDFEVRQGEVLGIIGKNGAGKSTLLKILSRVTAPTTGRIRTKGRIASLLEVGTGFHGEMTGRENIFMNGAVLGMSTVEIKSKLDEIIAFSGCEKYIDTPVKRYSSGMTVRLGFAVAAHLEPEILVVDEVLAVGDAEFQKKAIGKMQDLSSGEGRTVLFVSHNMASIKKLCNRGIVLNNGKISFSGQGRKSVEYYLSNYKVIPKFKNKITNTNRRINTSREVEIIEIQSVKKFYLTDDNLELKMLIRKNVEVSYSLCLTGTILDQNDNELGSFFTDPFFLINKGKTLELTIVEPRLAPGEYYLNFSLSKGNLLESNLMVLDHAYEVISFEVEASNKPYHYVKWDNNWGNFHFKTEIR